MNSYAIIASVVAVAIVVSIATALLVRMRRLSAIERIAERRQSGAERIRSLLNLLSIRTNVLALVLISVVGVVQVGVDIWRMNAPERSWSALEELLRLRLAESEIEGLRHKELIDAVRGMRPDGPSANIDAQLRTTLSELQERVRQLESSARDEPVPSGTNSWLASYGTSVAFFALLFGLTWAVFYALRSRKVISGTGYAVATASAGLVATLGSLAGGVTLLKDFSLVKSLNSSITLELGRGRGLTSQPQLVDVRLELALRLEDSQLAAMDCGEGNSRRIGPFDDGEVSLSDDEREKLIGIARSFQIKSGVPIAIMLIGSADKRSLMPKTARTYNSNQGLAQARVRAVRMVLEPALREAFGKEKPPILESYAGPSKTDARILLNELAVDRAVQICVFWRRKPETSE